MWAVVAVTRAIRFAIHRALAAPADEAVALVPPIARFASIALVVSRIVFVLVKLVFVTQGNLPSTQGRCVASVCEKEHSTPRRGGRRRFTLREDQPSRRRSGVKS